MTDTPEGLLSAVSQLFKRGEMRGLAILFRDSDEVAREALHLFLEKYGSTLANMIEGKPTKLGVTFELVTDSQAGRVERTTPYKLEQRTKAYKIGRLLIYAGAYDLMKNAVSDVSERTKKSESWLYAQWAKFNEEQDKATERSFASFLPGLMEREAARGNKNLSAEKLKEFREQCDNRLRWRREYDTGRVTLETLPESVFNI